jgi:uncharacterized protein YndB with AHSA1/START domain
MSEFETSSPIDAPADRVFGFVSEPRNLPRYLPTVHEAASEPGERIRLEGEGQRGRYASDGYFHVLNDQRRMEWGADGTSLYRGWLSVESDVRERSRCTLTVHLSFDDSATHAASGRSSREDREAAIRQQLEEAVDQVRMICESGSSDRPGASAHAGR